MLANTLQYSCLEKPPAREAWQAMVFRVAKLWTQLKGLWVYRCKTLRVEHEDGADACLAGTLVGPSVQGQGLPPLQELGTFQCLFFFFGAASSWRSEGLFGQSFSVALPIQALRGLPCLWSFSVVQYIRHVEPPTPHTPPPAGVLLCR